MAKGILIGEIVYTLAILVVKLSMLFLLHRIFPLKRFMYALRITGAVIIIYSMVQIIGVIAHCIPVDALWNHQKSGHCIDVNPVILLCSALNIVTDVAILCLPIWEVRKLKVTRRQRLQIISTFLLGGLYGPLRYSLEIAKLEYRVCIVSLIRITKIPQLSLADRGCEQSLLILDSSLR